MSTSTPSNSTAADNSEPQQQQQQQQGGDGTAAAPASSGPANTSIPVEDLKKESASGGCCSAAKEEEVEEAKTVPLGELFRYADTADWLMICFGCFFAFCAGAGIPAFSYIFAEFTQTMARGKPTEILDSVSRLGLIMTYVGIGVCVLCFSFVSMLTISSERQARRIREKYFEMTLRQEMAFHDEEKPGGLAARLFGDVTVIRNGINDKLAAGFMNFGMFIFSYGMSFYYSWRMTLVMLSTLPLITGSTIWFAQILEDSTKNAREHYAKAGDISDEVMSNIRTVQSFGSEDRESARFDAALQEAQGHGVKKEFATVAGTGTIYGINFACYSIAFWYSGVLISDGDNTLVDVVTCFFAVLTGSFGIGLIFPTIGALLEAQGAAYKVYSVIERESKIDPWQPGKKLEDGFPGEITFKDMHFKYPTREEKLFRGVNVSIKPGENVAFSGASGCGKSSFIALVQRMYDPVEGQVLIDGVDLKDLDLDWWRSQLGVVQQEPHMFSGTIEDNLRVGKADATTEEMEAACRRANIHDTIMSLPDKYLTHVGSATMSQMSGGQKQRLAIARALIRSPRVLILDEATSALDRQSEIEVQKAIDTLMHGSEGRKLTILVIAHRLATIRDVDTIHFIEHDEVTGSKICESGSYDALMAKGGLFSQMASRQSKSIGTLEDDVQTPVVSTSDVEQHAARPVAASSSSSAVNMPKSGEEEEELEELDEDGNKKKKKKKVLEVELDKELEEVDASMGRVYNMMPKKWPVYVALLGSLITGGMYPSFAVVFGQVLSVISKGPDEIREKNVFWSCMFIVIGVAAFVGWMLQGFYGYAGEDLTLILRSESFKAILRQDMKFFDMPGRDPGAMQKLLSGDCESVHQLWGPSIGTKVMMGFNLVGGIVVGMIYSWKVALVTLSTAPFLILTGAIQQLMITSFGALSGENTATVVTESLHNIHTVTSFNIHRRQRELYGETLEEAEQAGFKLALGAGLAFGMSQFSLYGVFALSLWYGGKLIADGEIVFVDVMIASMAVLFGAIGAGEAGGWAAKMADSQNAAKKVFSLLDRKPDIDVRDEGDKDISLKPDIALDAVEFTYPSRPAATVLKSFSTTLPYGRSLGFCGSTGSGKSSAIQILLRFYKTKSGTISVDGKPIDQIDIRTWRSRIAAVLQEPSLFAGSVRDNIKYTNADATDEDMIEAAKLAAVHDEIMEMDQGYDTDVGLKGGKISGGQKARVSLARAFCSKRPILIMDETTAALDNVTQAKVQENIDRVTRERGLTVISIAHRLTVLKELDKIILLDDGIVLESGTHQELMAMGGEFKHRWDTFVAGTKQ